MLKKQFAQTEKNDQKAEPQKLNKEQMKEATGGSYEPDTEQKDDDILLPEL